MQFHVTDCVFTLEPVKDESEQPLFCKSCTNKCDHCEIRGCKECGQDDRE